MKRVKEVVLLFFAGILLLPGTNLYASEIDVLVSKLVEKGILSRKEAKAVLVETKEEIKKDQAKGEQEGAPKWIRTMKLKGDLRLRYQADDKDKDNRAARARGRVRFRLGTEAKVTDQVKIAAGFASGSSNDARSTNQTFQDTFSSKNLWLDYAYAEFAPTPSITLFGGKMKRKPILWEPTDLLWDGDINPEGAALVFSGETYSTELFVNSGFFVLDESSSNADEPWMAYLQPGIKWKLSEQKSLKLALTGYLINSKGYDINGSADTNTKSGANHKYDYNSISPAFELTIKEPLGGWVSYGAFFGEYVKASDPSKNNEGWVIGFKFGEKKVKKAGQWQFKYLYRRLEQDAWLDAFPDSDAYDGDTHVKGHEAALKYGLAKNIILGLDYYYMEPIDTSAGHISGNDQQVLQVDVAIKF